MPSDGYVNLKTTIYTRSHERRFSRREGVETVCRPHDSKIKEVEYDWKKPWFSPESGGGLPQNIEGRVYNGINLFMLYLLSEEKGYSTPLYMTFMQAKEAGASIMRGENPSR